MCAVPVAGCTSGPTQTDPIAGRPPVAAVSPQTQAARAATALLDAFGSIPGATVSDGPNADVDRPFRVLERERFDSVRICLGQGAPAALADAEHGCGPPESRGSFRDRGYHRHRRARRTVSEHHGPATGGDGRRSELQVTVEVVYRLPKPAADHVPDSRVLTVTLDPAPAPNGAAGGGIVVGAGGAKTITSAPKIAQIAAELNALPIQPRFPAAFCPELGVPSSLTLDFAPSAHASASASTVVVITTLPSGICGTGIRVTVDGTAQPDLYNGAPSGLFTTLEKQAGFVS